MSLEIDPLRDAHDYHADVRFRAMPGLIVSEIVHGGMLYDRRASMIDNDDLVLSIVREGKHVVRQLGREFTVSVGEGVLTTSGDPGLSFNHETERVALLRMPCHLLQPLVGDIGAVLVRPIGPDLEAMRLLRDYWGLLAGLSADAPADVQHAAAAHAIDLVALALGATRDAAHQAAGRGVRVARLHSIKQDIRRNLGSRDLSATAVATRHGISGSYMRRLFDGEGTSFTDFVLGQRLARAHRLLTDPRFATLKISTIAFDAGFGDLSYFNRSFRRNYGITPSEARAQALDEWRQSED